jgi:hypothetical protein
MVKRLLTWAVFGAALGNAVLAWLGMKFEVWYATPGEKAPVSCAPQVQEAFARLAMWELVGAGAGMVAFLILGALWGRRAARKALVEGPSAKPATV